MLSRKSKQINSTEVYKNCIYNVFSDGKNNNSVVQQFIQKDVIKLRFSKFSPKQLLGSNRVNIKQNQKYCLLTNETRLHHYLKFYFK